MDNKKLPPGNSEINFDEQQANFYRNKSSVYKIKFHMVKGIINVFDHIEFCLVITLTMGGNRAVTWPPINAIRYVSLAPSLMPGSNYLLPTNCYLQKK